MPALRVKTATLGKTRFHQPSQSDVHIIAAQQQMIANRNPLKLELGFPFSHGDEAQVGGAATHVTHQNQTPCP
jgi:hypothetical protein